MSEVLTHFLMVHGLDAPGDLVLKLLILSPGLCLAEGRVGVVVAGNKAINLGPYLVLNYWSHWLLASKLNLRGAEFKLLLMLLLLLLRLCFFS